MSLRADNFITKYKLLTKYSFRTWHLQPTSNKLEYQARQATEYLWTDLSKEIWTSTTQGNLAHQK